MRPYRLRLGFATLGLGTLLLGACSSLPEPGPTLAELPAARLPNANLPLEVVDRARIEADYRRALEMARQSGVRRHIQLQLADLEMARAEQAQQEASQLEAHFTDAIAQYQALITASEAGQEPMPHADALYYKLAKAYALDGQMQQAVATLDILAERFPASPYVHEARFRRAERAFSAADYATAEDLYGQVAATHTSAFAENARYMQGWSRYKQGRYDAALLIFTRLLDEQLASTETAEQVDTALAALSPTGRNLSEDTLRVMSYSFANLDGAEAIAALLDEVGERPYQHLLYQRLGELYLAQQRHLDSAATFAAFVTHNPEANQAPDFSLREIDIYQQGNFPSRLLPAKRAFVENYGIYSPFWQARSDVPLPANPLSPWQQTSSQPTMSEQALAQLNLYLEELARHSHAQAQALEAEESATPTAVRTAYHEAARWYRELMITFPEANHSDATMMLLAEVLEAAGETVEALETYEHLAFVRQSPDYGAEAGYASVLLTSELTEREAGGEALWQWQTRKINNALAFAQHYPSDNRAVSVLGTAAPELLYQGRSREAAAAARQVIDWQPAATSALRYSAWLTLGHASFDLADYTRAEAAYWQALALHTKGAQPSAGELRERIAASLYQQAEAAQEAGDTEAAIDLWLAIDDRLPTTGIAAQALFDAGHTAQMQGDWERAETLLARFESRYPDHPLGAHLPAKMVAIYEQQENWQAAAERLSQLAQTSADLEQARQALLAAAEYYAKADQWEQARNHYRDYAHTYAEPVSDLLEVEQRLAELYTTAGDTASRDFWLGRLVERYRQSNAPSDRLRYLAAQSSSLLAETSYRDFTAIPLILPLDKSLQRKQAALQQAIAAQQTVLDYRLADFTTRANFHIGEIYVTLARDLISSQRPADLNALELEQYDLLLEEEAFPFEERAIELHQANARRSHDGLYDQWVKASIESLARLLPARYGKREQTVEQAHAIH